jgi:alkanesulfonate monooxygenase SsuD/methylene tetrahydromethanopterin reductase-like flavin-dependent oxidoreductase (luciferase family)
LITPWVFDFFYALSDPQDRTDPKAVHEHLIRHLDLIARDEDRGFEGVFFSEHHFGPSFSPAPNLLIANLAARTTTLRLGVIGVISAYASPWRVFEEFAVLDHLTNGRLEMGLVIGNQKEMEATATTAEEARARHLECLSVLQAGLRDPVQSHKGKHYWLNNVRLTPVFFRQAPRIWTAVRSESSAYHAGEQGLGLCLGLESTEHLVTLFDAYRAGAASAGRPASKDLLALRRQVGIVPLESQRDEAIRIVHEGYTAIARSIGRPEPDLESMPHPDEFITGSPDQIATEIISQCEATGAGNFVARFNAQDDCEMAKQHDLFGKHVIPALRAMP